MGRKRKFGVETKPYTNRFPPSIETLIPASYDGDMSAWIWDLANDQVHTDTITQAQKDACRYFYMLFTELINDGKLDKELTDELKQHAAIFREMTV